MKHDVDRVGGVHAHLRLGLQQRGGRALLVVISLSQRFVEIFALPNAVGAGAGRWGVARVAQGAHRVLGVVVSPQVDVPVDARVGHVV